MTSPTAKIRRRFMENPVVLGLFVAWMVCLPIPTGAMPERFFAPYVDATLYPKFDIAGTAQSQGTLYYTLAFIVAAGDTAGMDPLTLDATTLPAWGGQNTLRVNSDYMKGDIEALRAQGGDVMLSFGGAANTELAGLYSNPYDPNTQPTEYQQRENANVAHLTVAYQFVIDTYGLTHIDFDVEGSWVAHPYSIQLRSKAVKALQDDAAAAGRTLLVWYTLPVLPTGLDGNGVNVLNSTLDAGIDLAGVNVMAMDYGDTVAPVIDPATGVTVIPPNIPPRENDSPATGVDADDKGMMGDYGIQAAQGLFDQLQSAFSSHGITLTDAQTWRKVGITPMIGVNDVQTEVVDLSEMGEIYQFALSKDIGMLSFWSITRDHPAPTGLEGQVSPKHSGLPDPSVSYAFSHLLIPFSGDGSEAIYVSDASTEEGDTGTKTVDLLLWRLPPTNETRVVTWSTADGTATAPDDYVADSGSVTFGPGETEKTITLTIANETLVEPDEHFLVEFTTTSGVPIPDAEATVTILDDDTPPSAGIADKAVAEDAGTVAFTVTLSRPVKTGLTATIDYEVSSGTATAGTDFTTVSGTLSFTGSETIKSVTVPITDDAVEETDEVFVVNLDNPVNVTLADNQGLGTIQDDDGTVTGGYVFYVNDKWGTGWVGVLQVTNPGPATWNPWQLSFDSTWDANFWESTYNEELSSDDGAGNWHHVLDPPGWGGAVAPGQSFQISWTGIGADSSAPTNVEVNGVALTQLNQGPGVSVGDVTSAEGDSGTHVANFTVSLSEAGSETIHVAYAVVGGTATAGSDYTAGNGTLVFAPGELTKPIPVSIIGDTVEEGDETVMVFIAGVDGETLPRITDTQGTLTITGDDWTPTLTTTAAIVMERDSGTRTATIKVRLNRAPKASESISVAYQTADATATDGTDYVAKSGTLNFSTGQTEKSVGVTINGDTDDETLERFTVDFSAPVGCLLGDAHAEIQIVDDDTTGSLEGRRVVAYVYGGGALPPAHRVTHINYAFSNLNADGSWAFSGSLSALKALRVTNPDLKILVSIGGWGWSENFSAVADDPVKRATFAQSAANLVDSHDIDGVDIDWEWPGAQGDYDTPPGPRDRENFTLLMQETRDALDALGIAKGRAYLLTAFTGAGATQMAGIDMAAVGQIFDFINVQGYDLHGTWDSITGHASGLHHNPADAGGANLNIESVLNIYASAGIPRDKLLVGAAFFARTFNGAQPTSHGLFQSFAGWGATPLYSEIVSGTLTASRYFWDEFAKVPWLYNDTTGEFVSFDDPRSCYEKAEFVRANGYGGVYFWQMGGDSSDFQLLTAIHDSSATPPATDTDNDGMDDAWEREHFGNLTTAEPGTDWDHDGQSDAAEFHAGTDPKDRTDFFHITSLTPDAAGHGITWNAVPGKTYEVEYSPDMQPGSWITIATGLTGGSFTDTDAGRLAQTGGFYRVRLP